MAAQDDSQVAKEDNVRPAGDDPTRSLQAQDGSAPPPSHQAARPSDTPAGPVPCGIHSMPTEQYHGDPADGPSLSSSIACILATQSPRHAWLAHPRLNPCHKQEESTTFDIGTAAHGLLLEGEARIYRIPEEFTDYKKNEAKAHRDGARVNGLIPLLAKHVDAVLQMRLEAIRAIDGEGSELRGILRRGLPEQALVWKDIGNVLCRARLDWLTDDRDIIFDYKSTTNANAETCIRRIFQLGYDIKADFYLRGVAALTGATAKFIWMFQETEPPYECCFVGAGPQLLALACAKVDRAIGIWRKCLAERNWPGYSRRIAWAEPPPWEVMRFEELRMAEEL